MAISLVQSKTGTATSLSFTNPTTAGNCVVVGFTDEDGATSVSAVKLGGSAGNFAQLVSEEGTEVYSLLAALWADPSCAGGQTAIAVTASGSAYPTIWIAEFSGIVASSPLDKTAKALGTAASWSSGSTATTAQAVELWLGAACLTNSSSPVGPSSPWVNTTVADSAGNDQLYGYQIRSSTGAAAYAGTGGGGSFGWAVAVATLKGAATSTVSPFYPPTVAKGKPSARRGSSTGAKGAPYVFIGPPSVFYPPAVAKGKQSAKRGTSTGAKGAPYVFVGPAPFYSPGRPSKGAQKALRGRSGGSPGAPYTFIPPVPSVFTLPHRPAKGTMAARPGKSAGHSGALYKTVPAVFHLPQQPAKGRGLRKQGRSSGLKGKLTTVPAVFHLPGKPAKGASRTRRTGRSSGIQGVYTKIIVPRTLLISLASAAGVDDYGNAFPQGIFASAGVIEGPEFIGPDYIFNSDGAFWYDGTPAAGNLVTSVAGTSGGIDDFGNTYYPGVSSYGTFIGSITAGAIQVGSAGAFDGSGPQPGVYVATDDGEDTLQSGMESAGDTASAITLQSQDLSSVTGGQIIVDAGQMILFLGSQPMPYPAPSVSTADGIAIVDALIAVGIFS